MEPENHLFEKENHLNQTIIFRFYVDFFGGVGVYHCDSWVDWRRFNKKMFPVFFIGEISMSTTALPELLKLPPFFASLRH